ncbi:VanZ family protein [Pleionea mediterranea]|uniref:VanZ like protein n=1 Tax=Pleionea mediterranea TaxID=523701 RepID=A0A316FVX8_9GAMM|nr:VanZ family protein [Pleionea mediterranea]PWK52871.1 hypothetical protein C8D97_10489 [Pleionea mediterranea]
MPIAKSLFRFATLGATAFLLAMLFMGGPDISESRLLNELWQTGHFFLFALLIISITQLPVFKQASFLALLCWSLVFSVVLGGLTEVIQLLIGRDFEMMDIANDALGGITGAIIVQLFRQSRYWHKLVLTLPSILLAFVGTQNFWLTVIDESHMKKSFPVLADFSHQTELTRWHYQSALLSLYRAEDKAGNTGANGPEAYRHKSQQLKALFQPSKSPTITLKELIPDWRNARFFQFSVYNTTSTSLQLTVKVSDKLHAKNYYAFNDRYNKTLTLQPGWNHHSIDLNEIKTSPATRAMQMDNIDSVSWYLHQPKSPVLLYFDDIKLSN